MNLIIYNKSADSDSARLQLIFEPLVSRDRIEISRSVKTLRQRILKTSIRDGIVILIARERNDLTELLPIIDLFRRVRIILLLPDRKPETIKIGYQLEPRFMSFIDRGFEEVRAVLAKMIVNEPLSNKDRAFSDMTRF